jgi:UDP-N-acetylglucosamine 2-epimerase (non-hydrolysing)
MIALVYGTRPEAIKLAPVAASLRRQQVPFSAICTGQHTDLLAGMDTFKGYNYHYLKMPSQGNIQQWVERAVVKIIAALRETNAQVVVVQGDTMSALAAARASRELGVVLAHVEAGVRSGNMNEPYPEEMIRIEITSLADWHYAPTSTAFANLVAESIALQRILVTGNTVVSALAQAGAVARAPEPYLLMTMHRREWLGKVDLVRWGVAVAQAAQRHPTLSIIWPMHPAISKVWANMWDRLPAMPANVNIRAPMPHKEALSLLGAARGLCTDSGGLVEEAATLGVPTAILRRYNDRPEAVEVGIARQYAPSPEGLLEAITMLSSGVIEREPTAAYGDASAAEQVARHLAKLYHIEQEEEDGLDN